MDSGRPISHWIPPCGAVANWTNLHSGEGGTERREAWYMGTGLQSTVKAGQLHTHTHTLLHLPSIDKPQSWGSCVHYVSKAKFSLDENKVLINHQNWILIYTALDFGLVIQMYWLQIVLFWNLQISLDDLVNLGI